jgi:rhomboid family GlyGly-CTERM serine protease
LGRKKRVRIITKGGYGFVNRVHGWLKSLNCDGRRGVTLLGICASLLALTATGEAGRIWLRYDRAGLAHGELWRLVSAHLVHLGLRHAALNCLGLVLVWALYERAYRPRQWLLVVLAAMAAIDAGLWFADSTVQWYVGSSGVLHALMAAGALAQIRRKEREGWILAVVLLGKLLWEQIIGALPLSGAAVVVDAHLYGVIGGLLAAAFLRPRAMPL